MKKIFFNHIPKTAGTTFYEYISRFYKESEIYPKSSLGGYESISKFDEVILEDIKFIANHKNFREYLDDSWSVITFVRNPKDRLISLYNHWKNWTDEEIQNAPTGEEVKNLKKLFKEKSLTQVLKLNDPLIRFHFVNGLAKNLIPLNKHHLINNDKKLLKEAKKQLDNMFFIGVTERFKESQFLFEYLLRLPHEKDLENLNTRKYDFSFTKEEEDEINKILEIDNQIYKYAVKKFEENLKKIIVKEINLRAKSNSDLKVFFLHVMKSGGTSVIDMLKKHFNEKDIVPLKYHLIINSRTSSLNNDLKKQVEDLRENPIYKEKVKNIEELLPEKASISELDFKIIFNNFKFMADHTTFQTVLPKEWSLVTILRDPKDRILSQINDLKTASDQDVESIPETTVGKRDLMLKIKKMSSDEILSIDNNWIKEIFINTQTKMVAGFFGKTKTFFEKTDDEILNIASNNLNNFLAVGIHDKFFESIALLHYKLGIPFDGSVAKSNVRNYEPENVSEDILKQITEYDQIIYKQAKEIFYKQYFEMLEGFVTDNFQNNRIEKKQTLLMSDDFIGSAWHQREGYESGQIYRWTGPSNVSTIKLPFFLYQVKQAEISIVSAMHSEIIWNSKIYLNNRELDLEKEDLGNGHFVIKFKNIEDEKDFAELKIESPYTISHAEIRVDKNDSRKKGLAITKIEFVLNDFIFHGKPVVLCSSLGTECGISTYTELLSKSNQISAISNLSELGFELPSHIHLQHEFGIAPYDFIEKVIDFCKKNDIKFYVTMHTVLPKNINIYSRFFRMISPLFFNKLIISFAKKIEEKFYRYKIIDKLKWMRWKIKEGIKFVWWKFNVSNVMPVNWERILGDNIPGVNEPWRPFRIHESWMYFKNQNLVIKNSDKIFAHSKSAKKTLLKQGAKDVELYFHPSLSYEVSMDLHSEKDDKIHFGFFGFFNKDKSIYETIQSCKKIENRVLHIYSCVRKDHDQEYLKKIEAEVEKNEWIKFHREFLPLGEIIFNLSKCDILLWNSKPIAIHSSSGSIRQYLAAKRPIIARKNNLIEDLEGIINIVDDINSETLSREIKKIKFDNDKIKKYLDEHSWENSKITYD